MCEDMKCILVGDGTTKVESAREAGNGKRSAWETALTRLQWEPNLEQRSASASGQERSATIGQRTRRSSLGAAEPVMTSWIENG